MIESFEFTGAWWDPSSNESTNGAFGTLVFSPEHGATLELVGQFSLADVLGRVEQEIQLLIGVTTAGKHVTLLECFRREGRFVDKGLQTLIYDVEVVFVGAHLETVDALQFERIDVQYSSQFEWSGVSGFDVDMITHEDEIRGARVDMVRPDPLPMYDGQDYKITITSFHNSLPVGFGSDRRRSIAVTVDVYFQIDFVQPTAFDQHMGALYYLETFMTLSVGERIRMNRLEGLLTRNDKVVRVAIHYKQRGNALTARDVPAQRMLFTYPALKDNIDTMFGTWVTRGVDLQPMYNLFFSVRYAASTYIESEFLVMIQSFESLTRYLKNMSGNDFDMEKELLDIVQRYSTLVAREIPDQAAFARETTLSRHYYSHRNLRQQHIAKYGRELVWITTALEHLLEIELLRMLGVSMDALEKIFDRRRHA